MINCPFYNLNNGHILKNELLMNAEVYEGQKDSTGNKSVDICLELMGEIRQAQDRWTDRM